MKHGLIAMAVAVVLVTSIPAVAGPPKALSDERLAAVVRTAPACPGDLDLGLKVQLIDYIDCTNPGDPHDFRDQGTSKVVTGSAGKYRVTAAHRHAFFSYAHRSAGRDKPVLVVIEYPDDADRVIGYTNHDSMRPAKAHVSFTQETGVLTGGALPVSNGMKYFTLVSWPQDDWTPLIVLNYGRAGGGGAAARVWVYRIDAFEPLEVDAPDPANQRTLDAFFCLAFLAKRDNFGWKSKQSIEHMCDYMKLIGVNRVTMECYANQGWGAMCTVPAWDIADDKGYLDDILTQMDRKGGVDFLLGIVADGMYGDVKAGGKKVSELPRDQAREVVLKGFDQLTDRYGKYTSMKGFALGSMETIGFYDTLKKHNLVDEVVAHIKRRRPDFHVITYAGNVRLQTPYFSGRTGCPMTTWDVMAGFEKGAAPWPESLASAVSRTLKAVNHDPAVMRKTPGLDVYEMTHPNDHRLHDLYTQEARQGIYLDVLHSAELARIADTPYGAIFDTFTEGHIGFHKDVDFWYSKNWTAPDFNFAGPLALMPYALLEARRDRQAISAGAWTAKHFGYIDPMRRWAKAFRSLPPVDLKPVTVSGLDTVSAYSASYKGKRYTAVVSRIPFEQQVTVNGRPVTLPPYGLDAQVDSGAGAPVVRGTPSAAYAAWVGKRLADYRKLCDAVGLLNAAAAPQAYLDAADRAEAQLAAGRPYAADVACGYGLATEMALRKDILDPPQLKAPRIAAAPPMNGNLDTWPEGASDVNSGDRNVMGHIYFPNNWTGPQDASIRLRLAHDGTTLYVGIAVRDQKLTERDSCDVWLSAGGYLDWSGEKVPVAPDIRWPIALPRDKAETSGPGRGGFTYTCRRTADGYVAEGKAPLADLKLHPGGSVGFLAFVSDDDDEPTRSSHSWGRKLTLMLPHRPNYQSWADARNCGKLILGQ